MYRVMDKATRQTYLWAPGQPMSMLARTGRIDYNHGMIREWNDRGQLIRKEMQQQYCQVNVEPTPNKE